jgi:hypothetical protein
VRRIYEYCLPLEDARACRVPGGVSNILIVNKVLAVGRVTVVLVNERLGF